MAQITWQGVNTITFNNVAKGVPFTEILNTELDNQIFILPSESTIYRMESLDKITFRQTINGESIVKNYVIDDIHIEQVAFGSSPKYKYTIVCVSPEKMLQGITLPNRALTQLIGRTRTCFNAMEKLRQLYCPNLTFTASLEILLASKPYPEMQWNRPTLFEVFNSLLSIFGCCVKMHNFTQIDYINLSETRNPISVSKFATLEKRMASKNYASNLDIELTNGITSKVNTIETAPLCPHSETGIITTDNCKYVLSKPIYELKRVTVVQQVTLYIKYQTGTQDAFDIDDLDITKQIVEQSLYNVKEIGNNTFILDNPNKKRCFFYYNIGGTTIDGLTYQEKTLFGTNAPVAYNCVLVKAATDYLIENELVNPAMLDETLGTTFKVHIDREAIDIRNLLLRFEYVSQDDTRFKVYKSLAPQNEYSQFDGQQDAFVDADNFGTREEGIINSMANIEDYRTGKVSKPSELEALGDYITTGSKKLILWKREYSLFDDYIMYKYYFSENFANQNLSALLTQRKRYTQIADASESLLRNELVVKKFKLSRTQYNTPLASYMMKLQTRDIRNKHIARTLYSDNTHSHYFILNSLNMKIGKSIVCAMKFLDNFAIGLKVDQTHIVGGYTEKQVPYTDNFGECDSIEINFGAYEAANELYEEDYTVLDIARAYPETTDDNPKLSDTIQTFNVLLYKDNREQLQMNLQFAFISGDDGFIYDGFVEMNPLIREQNKTFKVYESANEYTGNEAEVIGNVNDNATATIVGARITLSGLTSGTKGVALVYMDGTSPILMCAFNKQSSTTQIVRFLIEF